MKKFLLALAMLALGSTGALAQAPCVGDGCPVTIANPSLAVTLPGSAMLTASFTRPANTTAYAVGYLVANSTTAASVTPMTLTGACRLSGGTGQAVRVVLNKSDTVTANASFRVHLYSSLPTVTNGDGAAWLTTTSGYIGSFDVSTGKAFTDGSGGDGGPSAGSMLVYQCASGSTSLYALVEARSAYTPTSGDVFTISVNALRD